MSVSLFSLEVVVNFVKLQHEKVSCLFPSVAFRLLDYPSIAIHLLDEIDARELKSKLEISLSYQPELKLTHFRDLLDKHGRYIFAKGKSCLIRSELDTLRGHLRNAPLYVMLLDAYNDEYKLVGVSSMPLTNIMEEIYKELHETNLDMPCTRITHGVFDIKNLMNEDIGCISFACRLSSFGSTLMPHIGVTKEAIERQNQLRSISAVNTNNKQISSQNEVVRNQIENRSKQLNSTLVQTIPIDYKTAQIQISNADLLPDKVDGSTQMYEEVKIKTNHVRNVEVKTKKVIEDEFVFNHFCPPPLHYNSDVIKKTTVTTTTTTTTANVATAIVENVKTINKEKKVINEYEKKRIDYLNEAVENQIVPAFDNEIFISEPQEETQNEDDEGYISSQQQYFKAKPRVQTPQNNGFNLDNFPILKCLVDEISKLQSLGGGGDDFRIKNTKHQPIEYASKSPRPKSAALPSSGNNQNRRTVTKSAYNKPNNRIVGILKDKNRKQPPKFTKETMIESVNRLSQPKSGKTQKQNAEQEVESSEPETKPKPKPKLKYGTTNAYRMRVLASRPDQVDKINDEHLELIKKLKQNLDEITDSSQNVTPRSSLKKSTQKDNQIPANYMSISNSTYNNSKSPLDLSLLNKVEMESTIDYALSRNLINNLNANSQDNAPVKNSLQQSSNPQTGQSGSLGQNTKFVQFGNTYIFNHPSDESATTPVTNTNTSTTTTSTYSPLNQVFKNANQLQLPIKKSQRKSPRSQTSSVSSSKSKQTSDDFEDDDDDDEIEGMSIKMSQININSDDIDQIVGTSSKYSSNDFHSESKSRDYERNSIEEENIFSRDSRTSTTD